MLQDDEYKLIVESSPNMIWRAGTDGLCYYFNATWLRFTGRTPEQEAGNGWAEGVHPDDLAFCLKIYQEHFEARLPFEMEYRLRRRDGSWRWINDRGQPVFQPGGEFAGYIGSCIDVTERVEGQHLKDMAQHDALTGVCSRAFFEEEALRMLRESSSTGKPVCVAVFDIDGLKQVNDTYGHSSGDTLICRFAEILRRCTRSVDLLGRFGGDEFMMLLRDTDAISASSVFERITRYTGGLNLMIGDIAVPVSFSYGYTSSEQHGYVYPALFEAADTQMYAMKAWRHASFSAASADSGENT